MIPDAVAAVIAAVHTEHPTASPETLGRLAVTQLRAEGWHIAAPLVHVQPARDAA